MTTVEITVTGDVGAEKHAEIVGGFLGLAEAERLYARFLDVREVYFAAEDAVGLDATPEVLAAWEKAEAEKYAAYAAWQKALGN